MKRTKNLKLPQFELEDLYLIEDFNEAYETLDSEVSNSKKRIEFLEQNLAGGSGGEVDLSSIQNQIDEIRNLLDDKADVDHTHLAQKNCDTVDYTHISVLTQAEYDALSKKDSTTLYFIK